MDLILRYSKLCFFLVALFAPVTYAQEQHADANHSRKR